MTATITPDDRCPICTHARWEHNNNEHCTEVGPAVVAILESEGYSATWEYPGWISVAGWAIGDANGTWEGHPEDDPNRDGFDTDIPASCIDAQTVANAILPELRKRSL